MVEVKNVVRVSLVALVMLVLTPALTFGQFGVTTGISGVVSDASGAVLPGVTVEASSPVLIEEVRSVVTDGTGRYSIISLSPGTYVVTFSLSGFATTVREGIELRTGFTATVDIDMSVGGLEETVTVTGASPIVDVRSTRQQRVITREVMDTIPAGRITSSFAQLVPGLNATEDGINFQDVGGLLGEGSRLTVHGGRAGDTQWLMNGLPFNRNLNDTSSVRPDVAASQEINFSIGANLAEYQRGGVVMNMILHDGSNVFSGQLFATGANSAMQTDNLDATLQARGLQTVNALNSIWDYNFNIGGPIVQGKLWFFHTIRYYGTDSIVAGIFHDSNLRDFVYTPDTSRPAKDRVWTLNHGLRLTAQVAEGHKLSVYANNQPRRSFSTPFAVSGSRLQAPESSSTQDIKRNQYAQATYVAVLSPRVLFEAGTSIYKDRIIFRAIDGVPLDTPRITDRGLNIRFNSPAFVRTAIGANVETYRSAVSFVTGSHNFKAGFSLERSEDPKDSFRVDPLGLNQVHDNGVPVGLELNNVPRFLQGVKLNAMLGIFVQDQWNVEDLTLNVGFRYDHHHSSVPPNGQPRGSHRPAIDFALVDNVPLWNDWYPRFGLAYNLGGTGRTVIKGAINKYPVGQYGRIAGGNNPANTVSNSTTRSWDDRSGLGIDGDYIAQCDQTNPLANGECGPYSSAAFGTGAVTRFHDPKFLVGSGLRPYNWEATFGFEHELTPNLAVNTAFFRRWFGNFTVVDNRKYTSADFETFSVRGPSDVRLPGGGGQVISGLWNIKPASFGLSDSFTTFASSFGNQTEVYTGFDYGLTARLPNGVFVQGGFTTGSTATNNCFTVDSPQVLRFCDLSPAMLTQAKFMASFELGEGFLMSMAFQSAPGTEITASYNAPNADIKTSLGRDLAGGRSSAPVELIEPGTMYDDRHWQLDLRGTKDFEVGDYRLRGFADVFNIFNSNTVLSLSTGFGGSWLKPGVVVPGRLLKLGVELTW